MEAGWLTRRSWRCPVTTAATCVLMLWLGLALVVGAGCAPARPSIGLVLINLQAQFFNQIREGAARAAAEAGIDLRVIDGNNDPARQVQALESLVTQRVEAILVVAVDPAGIKPAVAAAREAGIPVLAVDARIDVPPAHAFIGVDNRGAGVLAGRDLLRIAGEAPNGVRVGVVGAFNSLIQNERRDGFLEVVRGASDVALVGIVDGRNVQEHALAASENLVTANPSLDFIYATGEPALIGAIAAVESQGRAGRVQIIGWDLSPQAIRGIRQGSVRAVIHQDAEQIGYRAVVAALTLRQGGVVPEEAFVPVTTVTRDNVEQFHGLFIR